MLSKWNKPNFKKNPWKGEKKELPFTNIEDLYNKLVGGKIRNTGRAKLILCPFHEEVKPSCALYPDTNSFYCFSCGAKGSSFDFVMKIKNCSFKEAINFINENQ